MRFVIRDPKKAKVGSCDNPFGLMPEQGMKEGRYTDILHVRTNLTSVTGDLMARTMTVDVGDELREFIDSLVKAGDYRTQSEVMRDALRLLREKQAESRLQALRDLLAEGISSGDAKPWNKDAFLMKVKARAANERD